MEVKEPSLCLVVTLKKPYKTKSKHSTLGGGACTVSLTCATMFSFFFFILPTCFVCFGFVFFGSDLARLCVGEVKQARGSHPQRASNPTMKKRNAAGKVKKNNNNKLKLILKERREENKFEALVPRMFQGPTGPLLVTS